MPSFGAAPCQYFSSGSIQTTSPRRISSEGLPQQGRRYAPEQIITKLREAEVLQRQGMNIEEAARTLGIASQTYYSWQKEYGDMEMTQARKLKDLEKENLQIKKLVADLSLDNAILKVVLSTIISTTKVPIFSHICSAYIWTMASYSGLNLITHRP